MAMGLAMGIAKWKRRVRFWREHVRRAGLLSEEMESHLAMKVADLMEAGMTERDARSEARRRFGNVTRQMEESRAVWIARWMTDLVQDVCFAARTFRKQPGFTAAAVLSSALGIGGCATIFGIANVALLRPLPVEAPSRLMSISRSYVKTGEAGDTMSYPNFLDLRPARSFQAIAGYFPIVAAPSARMASRSATGVRWSRRTISTWCGRSLRSAGDLMPRATIRAAKPPP